MSVGRTSRLLAATVAGVVAAVGVPALTGQAPASAQPATTTYLCTFPEMGEVEVPLTVNVANLPAELPVGIPVPANGWDVRATLHLDDLTTSYLIGHTNAITAVITGLEPVLGDKPVPVTLASGVEVLPVAEPLDVPMAGTNSAFTPRPSAEPLPLELPKLFTIDLGDGTGVPLFSVACVWDADSDLGVIGTVSVVKQAASMARKLLRKPVKTTKRAKVRVTVVSQTGGAAPGQVTASLGGRRLALGELTDGRVVLKLARLRAGKHRVSLRYLGSRNVAGTVRKVTVKVVRPSH
jgi:hypothetical protein